MVDINQKNDFTADTKMTPEIMNQIGNNIVSLDNNMREFAASIHRITIGTTAPTSLEAGTIFMVVEGDA